MLRGTGTVARIVPVAVSITCNSLALSTVTNILFPSGLSAMESPPEPVTMFRDSVSVEALNTPTVDGALQQILTYAVPEDALVQTGALRTRKAITI